MKTLFSKRIANFGTIELRSLALERDIDIIYDWVKRPYATYWGMVGDTRDTVYETYKKLIALPYHEVYIGYYQGMPAFLMEKYKASEDRITSYYTVAEGDYGMHILVAPPKQKIHGFTWHVFTTVLDFFFSQPSVERIVVEPDINNKKIHRLNKKAGFLYQKEIELPEKTAALAFCTLPQYLKALQTLPILYPPTKHEQADHTRLPQITAIAHLTPETWSIVNQQLVSKAISEFAHELLLTPIALTTTQSYGSYLLKVGNSEITYEFSAQRKALDHWHIFTHTIQKFDNGHPQPINALQFITEFATQLKIPQHLLATYLEEITSTLCSAAYKYMHCTDTAQTLVNSDFQTIEHAMTEGHPCFVANNGRIGFDIHDYHQYAPEAHRPFKIYWLAGHKRNTTYTAIQQYEYRTMMHTEIGVAMIAQFNTYLESLGLDIESYVFIPVHPWQWINKIVHVFAADIANQELVFLGESTDFYSAQQSIRTLYNISQPEKMYTKTALSILNMGFMRGLSPYYMQSTPYITSWITRLLESDAFLQQNGFTMLGEVATVGYENRNYEILGTTNPHNKMLSALWRESPHSKITEGQQLMTMAAFLHIDREGYSLLAAMIKEAACDTNIWVERYLEAYLTPLLHCFYTYEMVFMPHGENIIMVLDAHIPIKILMKDITEEVILFENPQDMPEKVKRLYTKTSDKMKVLALFTDVFDSFFRFMSAILDTHVGYSENQFWGAVAACIYSYQEAHPALQAAYEKYDLFVSEFDRCCLNRLQLSNTKQMLDLAAPIDSLILEGTLQNPLAAFKKSKNNNEKETQYAPSI